MDELVLNNRRLKLINGEICLWKLNKNPYWLKVKYSYDGYYYIQLNHNKIKKSYRVHRLIYKFNNPEWNMTYTPDNQIDHIDNNTTNNNIENLRVVTNSENQQNILSTKGYYFHKRINKYHARIKVNNKYHHLGYHDTEEEAREAYLNAKAKYHTH